MTIAVVGLIGFAVLVALSMAMDIKFKALEDFNGCVVSMLLTVVAAGVLLALLIALGL